jgi:hypothetical protein
MRSLECSTARGGPVAAEPTFTIVDPPRSIWRRKRFLFPFGLSAVTALASVIALYASGAVAMPFTIVVEGLMASKADFFKDEQVKRILMRQGVQVHITDSGGSIDIPQNKVKKPNEYDFVMPSGQMVGEAVNETYGGQRFYTFRSPLVLGAFREYAEALKKAEVAKPQEDSQGHYYTVDIEKFSALVGSTPPTTWSKYGLSNTNQMIVQSPDPCQSYSGAAYVGLVAFGANDNKTMTAESVSAVAEKIGPVLTVEGQHENGLGFKFFQPEGRTSAPVAVIYEHQYISYQLRKLEQTGRMDDDRVLLYPQARHTSEPWVVSFSDKGERIGRLINDNADLRRRALELGFRLSGPESLDDLLAERGIPRPELRETESFMPKSADLARLISRVFGCKQLEEVPW